jgi:hypothetical protein
MLLSVFTWFPQTVILAYFIYTHDYFLLENLPFEKSFSILYFLSRITICSSRNFDHGNSLCIFFVTWELTQSPSIMWQKETHGNMKQFIRNFNKGRYFFLNLCWGLCPLYHCDISRRWCSEFEHEILRMNSRKIIIIQACDIWTPQDTNSISFTLIKTQLKSNVHNCTTLVVNMLLYGIMSNCDMLIAHMIIEVCVS